MGAPITPTRALFCAKSPEGNLPFLRGEDFLRFFPEPFPGAITTAAAIPTITATIILITITTITVTAISSTLIRVKVFPFREIF